MSEYGHLICHMCHPTSSILEPCCSCFVLWCTQFNRECQNMELPICSFLYYVYIRHHPHRRQKQKKPASPECHGEQNCWLRRGKNSFSRYSLLIDQAIWTCWEYESKCCKAGDHQKCKLSWKAKKKPNKSILHITIFSKLGHKISLFFPRRTKIRMSL